MRNILTIAAVVALAALLARGQTNQMAGEFGAIGVNALQDQVQVKFVTPFSQWSTCVVSPMSDMGSTRWWVKSDTTTLTLYLSAPGPATFFSYICRGT